jgi:5,10-methylenetetrahydromethanopterin reductase
VWGTVLDDGEDVQDARVRAAAGPGLAQIYHGAHEIYGAEVVRSLPGGPEWLDVIDNEPVHERHLAVHDGHCLHLNAADTAAWDAGAHTLTTTVTLTGTISELKHRVAELADRGVTEVVYQPAGDVPSELETFAEVMR